MKEIIADRYGDFLSYIRLMHLKKSQQQILYAIHKANPERKTFSVSYISSIERSFTKPSLEFIEQFYNYCLTLSLGNDNLELLCELGLISMGKIDLRDFSEEKKFILAQLVTMNLTPEQTQALQKVLDEAKKE